MVVSEGVVVLVTESDQNNITAIKLKTLSSSSFGVMDYRCTDSPGWFRASIITHRYLVPHGRGTLSEVVSVCFGLSAATEFVFPIFFVCTFCTFK